MHRAYRKTPFEEKVKRRVRWWKRQKGPVKNDPQLVEDFSQLISYKRRIKGLVFKARAGLSQHEKEQLQQLRSSARAILKDISARNAKLRKQHVVVSGPK